jgi:predicted O-methyltransferase YrrM
MSALFEAGRWLRHQVVAKGPHGIHSPYVFRLITEVLPAHVPATSGMNRLWDLRGRYLVDEQSIEVEDLGAGARRMNRSLRRVKDIARHSSSGPRQLATWYRLAHDLNPHTVLELGTNLGFGSAALAAGAPGARVMTIEGSKNLAERASSAILELGLTNVEVVTGSFETQLKPVLAQLHTVDLAVLDGNHRMEPTLRYFSEILPYLSATAVVLVDDIHWSREMEEAWKQLCAHPRVSLSLDFFQFGMLCFSERLRKESFVLRLPG